MKGGNILVVGSVRGRDMERGESEKRRNRDRQNQQRVTRTAILIHSSSFQTSYKAKAGTIRNACPHIYNKTIINILSDKMFIIIHTYRNARILLLTKDETKEALSSHSLIFNFIFNFCVQIFHFFKVQLFKV